MKRVVILGSTGSIGRQTLDVIAQHPDRLQIVGLAARGNVQVLKQQATHFDVKNLALYDNLAAGIPCGMNSIIALATAPDVDLVVVSVAGVIGLLPTIAAIKAGKDIALASKEVLVAAGELVMPLIHQYGVSLTPIDSEHSAIFQCLQGYPREAVERLILTASGGPFRGKSLEQLREVTVEDALAHPTWSMGGKITVDSATLMNKALEVIEAQWLFGVGIDNVDAVVHPQSVIHSMIQFKDGSVLGQLGWPDMRLPIQYALLYPERKESNLRPWSPLDTPSLAFEKVDEDVFPAISVAREAVKMGGTAACAFNAANEEVANAFLNRDVAFLDIAPLVARIMREIPVLEATLDNVLAVDAQARSLARQFISARPVIS